MVGYQGGGAGTKRSRFGSIKSSRVDDLLQLFLGNRGQGGGIWTAGKEGRGDLIHPLISALGRENGGDEKLKWGGEMQRAVGVGIDPLQDGEDLSGPAAQSRGRGHGAGAEAAGRDCRSSVASGVTEELGYFDTKDVTNLRASSFFC